MPSIALTGGIASGKTTFGKLLSSLGIPTVDADEIVHVLHRPGGEAAKWVARQFGPQYLDSNGATDRRRLGELVFADKSARMSLENCIHPLVREALLVCKKKYESNGSIFVAQIPLLFESNWERDWDFAATVETRPEMQLARLMGRGFTAIEAQKRIHTQLLPAERMRRADFILRNDADLGQLRQLAALFVRRFRISVFD